MAPAEHLRRYRPRTISASLKKYTRYSHPAPLYLSWQNSRCLIILTAASGQSRRFAAWYPGSFPVNQAATVQGIIPPALNLTFQASAKKSLIYSALPVYHKYKPSFPVRYVIPALLRPCSLAAGCANLNPKVPYAMTPGG